MTESDDFLSRWSRRKQDAAKQATLPAQEKPSTEEESEQSHASPRKELPGRRVPDTTKSEPAFDLSKLPSLDSIGAQTDIRMFMQPGVPAALSRAALRRVWSADPAIRDFIGLSENSWDFTAPDAIPGFGPLLPTDDVKKLLAQVFGEDKPESGEADERAPGQADVAETEPEHPNSAPQPSQHADASQQITAASDGDAALNTKMTERGEDMLHSNNGTDASQQVDEKVPSSAQSRRRHGGALPT